MSDGIRATVRAMVQVGPERLEMQEFARPPVGEDDALLRIEACGICGTDIVVDTTPHATQPVIDAVSMARLGGTIVLAGLKGHGVDGFPSDDVAMRYQTVIGVRTVDYHSYRQAVRLIESGALPVERLHTHHFPLEQAADAVQTLVQAGKHQAVSITVEP